MRTATLISLTAGALLAAAAGTYLTNAGVLDTEATGCPVGAGTSWSGKQVSISWAVTGIRASMVFQPKQIVIGGRAALLTPVQVQAYAPILDNLRAAASARRKVTIYWDEATMVVSMIYVRWDLSC